MSASGNHQTRRATVVELLAVSIAFAIISVSSSVIQRMERLYGDAEIYQRVAVQFFESRPISAQAPWAYRVATPWLAATLRPVISRTLPGLDHDIEEASGLAGVTPFLFVNIAASAAATLLLWLYLRCFIQSALLRVGLVIAWITMWHSPVRWVYFYPANVDALFMVALIGGLLVIEVWRGRPPLLAACVLAPIVFIGTLVREAMALVPLAFGVAQMTEAMRDRRIERLIASIVPVLALVLAALFVRSIVTPTPGHQQWAEVEAILRNKPIWTWMLGWFFTFGPPVIALIVAGRTQVWAFLRSRPEIAGHLLACAVLGYIAGTGSDTERLLAWGGPAVYVLAGQAIEHRRFVLARLPVLMALLLVVQIASSRVLWAVPVGVDRATRFEQLEANWSALPALADKFLIIHNYYANLWSFYGSRPIHAATLAFDLVLTVAVVLWISRTGRRLGAAAHAGSTTPGH